MFRAYAGVILGRLGKGLMATIYDARGNRYAVVTPSDLLNTGIDVPATAQQAAVCSEQWAQAAIDAFCKSEEGVASARKKHSTDGLLIGPFQSTAPFDLLIINTDGSLAERSGNGLTIFAQSLMDAALIRSGEKFIVNVHHRGRDTRSPVTTILKSAMHDGLNGFWLDMGAPAFGPSAVGAHGHVEEADSSGVSQVSVLQSINSGWTRSVFVRLGNPHCVSLVSSPAELPEMEWLGSAAYTRLAAIAFAASETTGSVSEGVGDPCPSGINLQWAATTSERGIMARVFERGEGPTLSSGSSACAVACAMWKSGQILAGEVEVEMPGGTAPIRLSERGRELAQVQLFGIAKKHCAPGAHFGE